jgi:hypothetical protein
VALFREQTQVATECASSRLTSFLDSTERMGEVTGKETQRWQCPGASRPDN